MLRNLLNKFLKRGDVLAQSESGPDDVGGKSVDTQMAAMMVKQILNTRDDELDCGECFMQLDQFVDIYLAGKNAAEALPLVEDHLNRCKDCRDEFETLLTALQVLA